MILQAKKIEISFNEKPILDNVSFSLNKGEKIGILGENGSGKTSLLRTIYATYLQGSSSSEIFFENDTSMFLVPQEIVHDLELTVIDFIKKNTGMLCADIDEYNIENDYFYLYQLETLFSIFSLEVNEITSTRVNQLSGGQRVKLMIMSAILKNPDILLLDEPTNNLDIESIGLLETYLNLTKSTVLIISHDVALLESLCERFFVISKENKNLTEIKGRYHKYLEYCERVRQGVIKSYYENQDKRKELEEEIRDVKIKMDKGSRYKGTDNDKFLRGFHRDKSGDSGKKIKSLMSQIERIPEIRRPLDKNILDFKINTKDLNGSIYIDNLTLQFDEKMILKGINLNIAFGEKVLILGKNGSGKSTLVKTVAGLIKPTSGFIKKEGAVKIGFLDQDLNFFPGNKTIIEHICEKTRLEKNIVFSNLVKFGLNPEDVVMNTSNLSSGQRMRATISFFALTGVNVIILDEPTNHLDEGAKEALTGCLNSFNGTVLCISHDRDFIKKVSFSQVFQCAEGVLSSIPNIDTYLQQVTTGTKNLLKAIVANS